MRILVSVCLVLLSFTSINFGLAFFSDPTESTVKFTAKHSFGGPVTGMLEGFSVAVVLSEDERLEKVEARIDSNSINTGHSIRDRRLRRTAFFDSLTHPFIVFKADENQSLSGQTLTGVLNVKGQSQELSLPVRFELTKGKLKRDYSIKASLNNYAISRKDYGMSAWGFFIDDEVIIDIDLLLRPLRVIK